MEVQILYRIRSCLLEAGRKIQIEDHEAAINILLPCEINLTRIRFSIQEAMYNIISNSLNQLKNICFEKIQHRTESPIAYSAERLNQGRGRPVVNISKSQLKFLVSEGYTANKISALLGCSKTVIYKACYKEEIKFRNRYSALTDEALEQHIRSIHRENPNCGAVMMLGYLKAINIIVPRKRVRQILTNIDPVGTALRWSTTVQRRKYSVPTPNSLWHIDAHLKLVRWGFVIHGSIDGFSRLITYVRCANSIMADVVLKFFVQSVNEYGLPSRVRSDHGYENILVAVLMNCLRGIARGTHITGRSVHNQRIERLWKDVFENVVSIFQKEFYELEDAGLLDPDNTIHKFALQNIYLNVINEKLELFKSAWNNHKIRTENCRSPREIWIDGMLRNINSEHTSTHETFSNQFDLETRLKDALMELGVDAEAQIIGHSVPISSLTATINISEEQLHELNLQLSNILSPRDKYISCVNLLNHM